MLDYDEYTHLGTTEESSPEALFFGSRQPNSSRFTSAHASPDTFSPFSAGMALKNTHSPEFETEGESPGIGSDMRGLRLNSRFPSPVQGTVRLEDVMMPMQVGEEMSGIQGGLFEDKLEVEHVENTAIYQRYSSLETG
jgi:hypothetical protein